MRRLRLLALAATGLLAATAALAQAFVGSEGFDSSSTAQWAFPFRTANDTTSNGLLTFNSPAGTVGFTKSTAGHGDQFYRWDGTPGVAGNYSTDSYANSWIMQVSATNLIGAQGSGKFAAIGIIARAGVASPVADSYTGIMLERYGSDLWVLGETNDFNDQEVAAVSATTDVLLRLAWDAGAKTMTGSYSTNGGATFLTLMSFNVATDARDAWPTQPTGGFAFDIFGYSNIDAAITSGQMTLDNFSLTAVPEPSTYAALAGLGAFGLVLWRRRRRPAA